MLVLGQENEPVAVRPGKVRGALGPGRGEGLTLPGGTGLSRSLRTGQPRPGPSHRWPRDRGESGPRAPLSCSGGCRGEPWPGGGAAIGLEGQRQHLEAAPPQRRKGAPGGAGGSGRIRRRGRGCRPAEPVGRCCSGHGFREGTEGPVRHRRGQPGR